MPRLRDSWVAAGFLLGVALLLLAGGVAYGSFRAFSARAAQVAEQLRRGERIEQLRALVARAESGQRGFLLTGDDAYLDPYLQVRAQLPAWIAALDADAGGDPRRRSQVREIELAADERLRRMAQAIELRREEGLRAALDEIASGNGRAAAILLEEKLRGLEQLEQEHLVGQVRASAAGEERTAGVIVVLALSAIVALGCAALLLIADRRRRNEAEQARNRLLEERIRLVSDLQEAVQARDDFLSAASHELRTPLTSLKLAVQSLSYGASGTPDRETMAKHLGRMERQVQRLTALIDNLLDVSRIATGRLRLDPEPFDMGDLAAEVLERFETELERAGCKVALDTAGELGGRWDRMRMDQVLTNLLTNAIKYGRGAPIAVEVHGDEETLTLRVRDRGIGIRPEDTQRIFERFERLVSAREYAGVGVGLWIVREIVDASGGGIEVESEPGRGSTFTIRLPRDAVAAERRATQAGMALPA